jgi:DnaJ family protein C protein 7
MLSRHRRYSESESENVQPSHHLHHNHHRREPGMVNKQSSQQLLHQARSAIVDQVRHDIRQSNNTTLRAAAANSSTSTTHPQQRLQHVLKENNQTTTTTTTGGVGVGGVGSFSGSRFPKSHRLVFESGDAENDKQYLEEKRRKAKMAERSAHEKMDETKDRIMERGRSRASTSGTTTSSSSYRHANTTTNSNVSQWMDSVVAKARHDASVSPPSQPMPSQNPTATESLREAAKNAREAVTRAVYGNATVRHKEEKENTPPPAANVVRRSFSDPSPSSINYQQHEETDAKVTKAMLKSALKQTGELRTELRETKLALDGVKSNLETTEYELKKEKENREEDKLKFEAEKNELETSREAAREALATEVSVTQELTKKLSAKRDEALEQRNLADKFKRELEQLRSELRNLKNENESWIRKAEAATSKRRSSDQQKEMPKVSSSQQQQQQQQQQRPQQQEQQKTTAAQPQQEKQQVNWTQERREAEELKTKGNRAFHANKFDEALQSYTAALRVKFEDNPFRAVLHANRAAALQSAKKHLEAIVACCESQFFDKSYIRAIQRRADAYLSIGDWTMAAKDLEVLVPIMGKECEAKLREVKMNIQRGYQIEHYAVLGVSSRSTASEIRASYLKKSLKHHPDKAETEHTKEIAELMFKRVCEAYKVLSDANKRRAYDNSRILGSSNAYNRRY